MQLIYALSMVTPPGADVLTSDQVKLQLRIDGTEFDTAIPGWIAAATKRAQTELRRQLINATFDLFLDAFPACIELPRGANAVTHVKYYDAAGVLQTLAPAVYVADVARQPGRIVCADGDSWPTVERRLSAVQVRFVAGYGPGAADVPAEVKQWMLMQIGSMKKLAESVVTGVSVSEIPNRFVDALLDGERLTVV